MKLYYAPQCLLAGFALRETGLPFEIYKLNAATKITASGEDFMRLNPKGYVPSAPRNRRLSRNWHVWAAALGRQ